MVLMYNEQFTMYRFKNHNWSILADDMSQSSTIKPLHIYDHQNPEGVIY